MYPQSPEEIVSMHRGPGDKAIHPQSPEEMGGLEIRLFTHSPHSPRRNCQHGGPGD